MINALDSRDVESFGPLLAAAPLADRTRRAAALTICANATSPADARHLLDITGLLDTPPRFERATPRSAARPVRRAHARRGRAT